MSETGNRGLDAREHWRTPRLIRFAVTNAALAITPSYQQNTHDFADGRKKTNDIFNNYIYSASHMRSGLHFQNVYREPCYANEADHVTKSDLKSKTKIAAVIMKWLSQEIPFICWNVGTCKYFWIPRSLHESLHRLWRYLLSVHDFSPSCLDMIISLLAAHPLISCTVRFGSIWPSLRSAKT